MIIPLIFVSFVLVYFFLYNIFCIKYLKLLKIIPFFSLEILK